MKLEPESSRGGCWPRANTIDNAEVTTPHKHFTLALSAGALWWPLNTWGPPALLSLHVSAWSVVCEWPLVDDWWTLSAEVHIVCMNVHLLTLQWCKKDTIFKYPHILLKCYDVDFIRIYRILLMEELILFLMRAYIYVMYKSRYKGSKQLVAFKEVQSKEKHYVNALFFELFFCVNLLSCIVY